MSEHTPESWVFDGIDTISIQGDYPSDQADVCYLNIEAGNEDSDWFADPAVVYAHGHLIAAAPDLLKELKHLVRLLEPLEQDGQLDVPGLATLNGARSAIARAEGRE